MIKIHDVAPMTGEVPFATQSELEPGNVQGLTIDCPICPDGVGPTHMHAVDVRMTDRVALFGGSGSRPRPTIDILVGCELGSHIMILEIGDRRGEMNIGIRSPYDGEVISVWRKGSFDNWALDGLVRFNPEFSHKAAK